MTPVEIIVNGEVHVFRLSSEAEPTYDNQGSISKIDPEVHIELEIEPPSKIESPEE